MQLRITFFAIIICLSTLLAGQLKDDFNHTKLSSVVTWTGDTTEFQIVDNMLNTLGPAATSELYLSAPNQFIDNTTWEFFVQIDGSAPSGSNKVRVYLVSDIANLEGAVNGYFLEIGQSGDDFLNLKSTNGNIVMAGSTVFSNKVRVRINRNNQGIWQLLADHTGGTDYVLEGSATDLTYTNTNYFGVVVNHTSSRKDDFFFDDFEITSVADSTFRLSTVSQSDENSIKLTFSYDMDVSSALSPENYFMSEMGVPESVSKLSANSVELNFPFLFNNDYDLDTKGVENAAKDKSIDTTTSVIIKTPTNYHFLVINEIMSDPSPAVGLPEAEFVELYNTSDFSINIEGFKLNGKGLSRYILHPKSYVLLTEKSDSAAFGLANCLGVSGFDALTNSGDFVTLKDAYGNEVDSLTYDLSWYQSSEKQIGGYSLELIDPLKTCADQTNWVASIDTKGGTPGQVNSVYNLVDQKVPSVIAVVAQDDQYLVLQFDEGLDTTTVELSDFNMEGNEIMDVQILTGSKVKLALRDSLVSERFYSLKIADLSDCRGNNQTLQNFEFYHDSQGPKLERIEWMARDIMALIFSEELRVSESEDEKNYLISNQIVQKADLQDTAKNRVHLQISDVFQLDSSYHVEVSNLRDTLGNPMTERSFTVTFGSAVDALIVSAPNILQLKFQTEPSLQSALDLENFLLSPSASHPVEIIQDDADLALFHLAFKENYKENSELRLYVLNLKNASNIRLNTPAVDFIYDTRAPNISSFEVKSDSQVVVIWNEPMDIQTSEIAAHYQLENIGQPSSIEVIDAMTFLLTFGAHFPMETEMTLSMKGMKDKAGVELTTTRKVEFVYDPKPPFVEQAYYVGESQVFIQFSEQLNYAASSDLSNYHLSGNQADFVHVFGPDSTSARLTFADIKEGKTYDLIIKNLEDKYANVMIADTILVDTSVPHIREIRLISDSSIFIEFSRQMDDAVFSKETYSMVGYAISSLTPLDSKSLSLVFENDLADGMPIELTISTVKSKDGIEMMGNTISMEFQSYFEKANVEGHTIELTFNTAFESVEKSSFEIEGHQIQLALIDGSNTGLVRLILGNSIPENQEFSLAWSGLTDKFGRLLPAHKTSLTLDTSPPEVSNLKCEFNDVIRLEFSEEMDISTVESLNNYLLDGVGQPVIADYEKQSVKLSFGEGLESGKTYQLIIGPVSDLAGNFSTTDTLTFVYRAPLLPALRQIIINEIMADPTPVYGLPEVEFVELYNNSDSTFSLSGIVFSDQSSSVVLPEYLLEARDYVILTGNGDGHLFENENTLELALPSLTNAGERLTLKTILGDLVDQVEYSNDWFLYPDQKDGGISLELINPDSECPGSSNWVGSTDLKGGTPGEENSVYTLFPDDEPSVITAFEVLSVDSLKVTFDEAMDSLSLLEMYFQNLDVANRVVLGHNQLLLVLQTPMSRGELLSVKVSGAYDCSGNIMVSRSFDLGIGDRPSFNDLLITEIMADPEPVVGLPNSEYLEVYNASEKLLTLQGLTLHDNSNSVDLPAVTMKRGEYLILVPSAAMDLFSANKVGISGWSSLNNTGESLSIWDGNDLIFEVTYEDTWHESEEKRSGGYSLEMKDVNNPCAGRLNWSSSKSITGGTPGFENSITASIPDHFGPNFLSAYAVADDSILMKFDEKLDYHVPKIIQVKLEPARDIKNVAFVDSRYELIVALVEPMVTNQPYHIEISSLTDCNGNPILNNSATVVLPDEPIVGDVVLNELLFNPKPNGVDFIELYNRSSKYLNLNGWGIANVESLSNAMILTDHYILAPSAYVALTTDTLIIQSQYPKGIKELLKVPSLPTMSNDAGHVSVLMPGGDEMDAFTYDEEMHLSLLDDVNGVSLERIATDSPTQDENNWTSGSSITGFATPGYINSQAFDLPVSNAKIEIDPKVFVPGSVNPAFESFTTINYQFDQSGQFANVTIYNQNGQPVSELAKGVSLGTSGFIRWDGTNYAGQRVRMGYYVVLFEVYDGNGNQQVLKETVVVGHQ